MKRIHALTVLLLCGLMVLAVSPVWGKKKATDLTYPPLHEIEIPDVDTVTLGNGMIIYLLEDHTLPRVNFAVTIRRCGSYLEPASKIGLAQMTGAVMRTGGTATKTGDEIDEELEAIGAYVETYIDVISGGAGAGGLSEYAETIVSIMADVLRHPVFSDDKIDLARTGQKTDISRRNDDPMTMCIREYKKLIYGPDSPYARHTEYATIDAVTRDDMIAFHKTLVQPNNIQLAALGDFNTDDMVALLTKYFGDWPRGTVDIPPPPDYEYTFRPTVNYAEKSDVNQSNILIGHIGGKMGDPDYPATIVMNSVLGGSFGSRLTNTVRTRLGLAYAAEGGYIFNYAFPGFFYAFAATKSESTVKAIRAMIDQIRNMQVDPPTEDEMRKAKDGWLNSFVFNFDSKGEIIGRIMTYDYYGMPRDYLQQLKEAVENITPEDVIEVANRKLNPDNLQILVVGKAEGFDEPLSVFGSVSEVDLTIPGPAVEEFAASPEELESGRVLLGKAAAACGGIDNFKNVRSVSSNAKLTINTPQGAISMDMTSIDIPPDKSAQIISTPMGEQTLVFDGTMGWKKIGGQPQPMPSTQLAEMRKSLERNMVLLFSQADQAGAVKVADKGREEFNGKPAIRLDFLTQSGGQFTMYLDPETHLPVGRRYFGETLMGPGVIVETMDDYREFGGIMIPMKSVEEAGGMIVEVETVTINVNGEYDASVFEKPEGI